MAISKTRLRLLVLLSLLETVLFGGLQYGWSSLLFILKSEGLFENLCLKKTNESQVLDNLTISDGGENTCFSQDERFNLLFSIGMAILTTTNVLSGQMHYKLGTKRTRLMKMFVFIAGVLFLGFASTDIPWLVLPGFVCVGVAGLSLLIADMQVAVLLKQGSSIYVGIINGFYDSSVLTQRVVKVLYENGVSRLYSYSGIAVLMLIISGACTTLFPTKTDDKDDDSEKKYPIDEDINTISSTISQIDNKLSDKYINEKSAGEHEKGDNLQSIICSRKYIFHLLWLSIMMLRFFYFIGSVNRIMEETFNDNDKVSYFTDVMTYTMMGGAVSSFLSGQLLHWQNKCCSESLNKVLPLSITSGLALLLSCLTFITAEESFYATFIILTIFRSFIFCVNMDFIIDSFPKKYMSVLFGLVVSAAGTISLLQYVLFLWTEKYSDAVKHVNAVLVVLSCLSFIHPIFLVLDAIRTSKTNYTHTSKL